MGKEALSSAFSEMILEEAKKDKNIMVVCTDSRGSAKLGAYPDELPEQFVEMGIAEQNSVTVPQVWLIWERKYLPSARQAFTACVLQNR